MDAQDIGRVDVIAIGTEHDIDTPEDLAAYLESQAHYEAAAGNPGPATAYQEAADLLRHVLRLRHNIAVWRLSWSSVDDIAGYEVDAHTLPAIVRSIEIAGIPDAVKEAIELGTSGETSRA